MICSSSPLNVLIITIALSELSQQQTTEHCPWFSQLVTLPPAHHTHKKLHWLIKVGKIPFQGIIPTTGRGLFANEQKILNKISQEY